MPGFGATPTFYNRFLNFAYIHTFSPNVFERTSCERPAQRHGASRAVLTITDLRRVGHQHKIGESHRFNPIGFP
jgi:hypothetical protein